MRLHRRLWWIAVHISVLFVVASVCYHVGFEDGFRSQWGFAIQHLMDEMADQVEVHSLKESAEIFHQKHYNAIVHDEYLQSNN